MKANLAYAAAILSAIILGGCTKSTSSTSQPVSLDQSAPVSPSKSRSNTALQKPAESSGDIDTDIETIEQEFDSLDVDSDFPTFSESDFE